MFDKEEIELLDNYKDKYDYVYMSTVGDIDFVWREITRKEYKKINQYFPDLYDREEELCRMCVLEPEGFDFRNCDAGIPYTLANQILYESGFSQDGTKVNMMLNQYRAECQSFEARADALITEAFPTIRIEEIETWSTEKIIRYYTLAEYKLTSFRGVQFEAKDNSNDNFDPADFPELRGY